MRLTDVILDAFLEIFPFFDFFFQLASQLFKFLNSLKKND